MTNKEQFKEDYKTLENWCLQRYHCNVCEIKKGTCGLSKRDYNDLQNLRHLRNFLSHVAMKEQNTGEPMISIHWGLLQYQRTIIDRLTGMAMNIAVPFKKMFCCSRDMSVRCAVETMMKRDYTHVPIVDEQGCLQGVFSENSLLTMLEDGVTVDSKTTFEDIWTYVSKPSDERLFYAIRHKDWSYKECVEDFEDARRIQYRLDMILFTEDGSVETPICGMVTAWDLAGNSQ